MQFKNEWWEDAARQIGDNPPLAKPRTPKLPVAKVARIPTMVFYRLILRDTMRKHADAFESLFVVIVNGVTTIVEWMLRFPWALIIISAATTIGEILFVAINLLR